MPTDPAIPTPATPPGRVTITDPNALAVVGRVMADVAKRRRVALAAEARRAAEAAAAAEVEARRCPRCGDRTRWVDDETGAPAYCDPCRTWVNGLVDQPIERGYGFDDDEDEDDPNDVGEVVDE